MGNRKSKVLLAAVIILGLMVAMLLGTTFALFSDNASVNNRLESGTLKVGLYRTTLSYTEYDEQGDVVSKLDENRVDLRAGGTKVFETDNFAPGLMQRATLELVNDGTVPFTYTMTFVLVDGEPYLAALAEQVEVLITKDSATVYEGTLADFFESTAVNVAVGEFAGDEQSQTFEIALNFLDDANNNAAQDGTVCFDINVRATQKTA